MPGKHNFKKMMGYMYGGKVKKMAGGGTPGMDDIMETEEYKKVMKKIGGKNKADRTGESTKSGSLAKGKFEKIRGDGKEVQDYNDASTRFKASAMKADEVVNTKRDLGGGAKMTLSDKKVKPKVKDSDIEKGIKPSPKKAKDNLNFRVKERGQTPDTGSVYSDKIRNMSAKELKASGFKQYQNKPYEKIMRKAMGMKSGGKPKAYGMKHGGQACRGGGKATRGTKFTMR
tara:strand:+ start:3628 stop:4314 length:687 start_codon:yes stop_codon:yes gene_type:complete